MTARLDDSTLNDWVEGTLSPDAERRVAALLERDPAARERLEAMRADRDALRGLPVPSMPLDLHAIIDDELARHALLGPAPSTIEVDWRQRRRRAQRWATWRPTAIAAGLLLGVGTTAWLLWPSASPAPSDGAPSNALVGGDRADLETESGREAFGSGPADPLDADAPLHHGLPSPLPAQDAVRLADAGQRASGAGRAPHGDVPDIASARFAPAVVLALASEAELESMLATALVPSLARDEPASLVRNLSRDAVRAIAFERRRGGEPLLAGLDASLGAARASGWDAGAVASWRSQTDDALGRLTEGGRRDDTEASGRVIAGERTAPPAWGDQLVASESGAAWTISVPARRLEDVLLCLFDVSGGTSRLGALDQVSLAIDDTPASSSAVRARLQALIAADPDAVVHLPVAIARD